MSAEAPLTTIIDWYQQLPKRAREGMSLANLHDLAKRITAAADEVRTPPATSDTSDGAPMRHTGQLRDDPIPSTPPPPVMGGSDAT